MTLNTSSQKAKASSVVTSRRRFQLDAAAGQPPTALCPLCPQDNR